MQEVVGGEGTLSLSPLLPRSRDFEGARSFPARSSESQLGGGFCVEMVVSSQQQCGRRRSRGVWLWVFSMRSGHGTGLILTSVAF